MATRFDGELIQITSPRAVSNELRGLLISCWVAVTNDGGAVGFPFPPVTPGDVAPAADELIASLHPDRTRLLGAICRRTVSVADRRFISPERRARCRGRCGPCSRLLCEGRADAG